MMIAQSTAEKSLEQLLAGIAVEADVARLDADLRIEDMTLDSRHLKKGSLFAAIPGSASDGREFVQQALEAGAGVVLFEKRRAPDHCLEIARSGKGLAIDDLGQQVSLIAARLFDHPSAKMKVAGITGTNGKSTCALLLGQALEALGERAAVMGTLGCGLVGELAPSALTTLDAVTVQRFMAQLLEAGATALTMEVSSHGLDQGRVNAVQFDVAVFTNLSQDHLDYHGSMADYAAAKKKLFALPGLDAMVINSDDALGREIIAGADRCRLISYGLADADITPVDRVLDADGTRFIVEWAGQRESISAPLIGDINTPNMLAVVAALLALEFSLADIARVFPRLAPPPGRMELFRNDSNTVAVVVDYSHTPDAIARALAALRPFCRGQLWIVFGCGGNRDAGKRALMGRAAADAADHVIVTNDNPRSESPEEIARQVLQGLEKAQKKPDTVHTILDRRAAIAHAVQQASAGDMVLVAGKGHEMVQIAGDQRLPFSDREVVRELLGEGR